MDEEHKCNQMIWFPTVMQIGRINSLWYIHNAAGEPLFAILYCPWCGKLIAKPCGALGSASKEAK